MPEHLNRGIDLTREYEALAREALGKLLGPPTHRRRVRPPGRLRLRLPARLRSILGPNAGADAAKNAEAVPSRGFLDTIEVRFPVDPRHALLMTWRGDEDTSVCGSFAQACNMNASISRQADKEWFFKPGAVAHRLNPATLQRDVVPISTELFPEYTSAAALRSRRRLETERVAAQIIQEDPPPDRMPFVNTRRRRGSGTA